MLTKINNYSLILKRKGKIKFKFSLTSWSNLEILDTRSNAFTKFTFLLCEYSDKL